MCSLKQRFISLLLYYLCIIMSSDEELLVPKEQCNVVLITHSVCHNTNFTDEKEILLVSNLPDEVKAILMEVRKNIDT